MAQKSIMSFFAPVQKKDESINENITNESDSDDESKVIKVKRKRILSSDDDDDEKSVKTSPPKKKMSISAEDKRKRFVSEDEDDESPKKKSPIKSKTPTKEEVKSKSPKSSPKSSPEVKVKTENITKSTPKVKSNKKTPKSNKKETKNSKNKTNGNTDDKKIKKEEEESDESPEEKPQKVSKYIKVEAVDKSNVCDFFTPITKNEIELKSAGQGQKGADYNPSKKNYHPIKDAFWERGEKVPYLALARTFEIVEDTSGRLRTIEILSNFFRSVFVLSPSDLLACVYLCLNQLAPTYEGLELGIAETTLMKSIAQTTGRTMAQIKNDTNTIGDLGIVAERSRSNQRMMFTPAPHTVSGMFTKLKEIAKMTGTASVAKKLDKIQSMFVACRHAEARFFIRSLAGKLRIGLAEQSLLQALAVACANTPPNQEFPPEIINNAKQLGEVKFKSKVDEISLIIKTTYCQCPNYDKIVDVILTDGVDGLLKKCPMIPGTPLKPMLAHPTKGVSEVLQRFENIDFTCEWKYDGERAQIHMDENGKISIYSRNQEDNTSKYPDIISRIDVVKKSSVKSCILDCEAVAWDMEKKQILPFQVLSTRKRKDATESDIKVQVCVYMFDLLYYNNEPLVTKPFLERRKLLHENFNEVEGVWKFATFLDTNDIDELQNFLEDSVKGNCEGLMVKTLQKDASYEIAKRSRNWLKLKKDYMSGVGDSLDLVVIGGYRGRGKRTGTYGGFLLACYDQENEEYQSICKIGTGFSDEDLQTHSEFLKPHIVSAPKSYYRYDSSHEPDDWFDTVQVWEVKCADLSLSPVHLAGIGIVDPEKGISLRFPRFIRIRDDKSVEDATSAQQVADMYSNQDQIKNQGTNARNIEEDFY